MFQPRKDKHPGFGLTDHDKKNLNFLLSMTPDQIADWTATASTEDLLYAKELAEINHILNVDTVVGNQPDYQSTNQFLQKYTLRYNKTVAKQPVTRRIMAWLRNKLF